MSSKKEEKSQAAADKIKAATLTAAKGLSRAQAERAATAAARNVNAYGQKEEGPSRWQERKEAKRQMYLMSTEKAVRLGERKTTSAAMGGGVASQCQKCFQTGHWTYECKNERVYISRPSRSQQLKNPKLRQKLMTSYEMDNPDIQDDENVEKKDDEKAAKKKKKKKSKRKYREDSKSGSDSEASVFDSDSRSGSSSVTGSDSNSSSDSSSSDSEEDRRRRKKRKQKKTVRRSRSKKYASSSEDDSEDGSDSDSDSDDRPSRRKKSRRHSRRR